jgi:hypothetical protein
MPDREEQKAKKLLRQITEAARVVLHELEELDKIEDDAERGRAVRLLLARRVPVLRLVTTEASGESAEGRASGKTPSKH